MGSDDRDLIKVCKLFDKNNINYWVCHGSLLGIIREGRLLPWDHDIDFAVWSHEHNECQIRGIMISSGYIQESMSLDMDCLHFYGEEKKIDISFYKIYDGIASIKWACPPESAIMKLIVFALINVIDGPQSVDSIQNSFKRAMLMAVKLLGSIARRLITRRIRNSLVEVTKKMMIYTGYSYPKEMLDVVRIEYKGYNIPVPLKTDKCLEMTYGRDWRTPKRDFIWHQEAENLTRF